MPNLYPPKKRTRPNLESFLVNAGLVSVSGRSRMPETRAKARCAGGGLTIYVQKDTPGADKEANWLPAPDGQFFMILRTYLPSDEIVNQTCSLRK
jgi:hypothetical protein